MKSPIRSYMKKGTYDVPGSISHTKSLLRHKPVLKFGNSHKTSTSQDQLKMVEYKDPHMEFLTQFYMKKNTYDVPSSVRHPKNAPSVSLNLDLSPNMAKKALKVFEYEQKAHQVQKKLQHEQKKLRYKKKTSSDSDTRQDQDLAKFEGLHPREGITRHHAILVAPELCHV